MFGLTFDYGQRALEKEVETAALICRHYDVKHKVVTLDWYKAMSDLALLDAKASLPQLTQEELDDPLLTSKSAKSVWIPNRNGVFVNVAASIAEAVVATHLVVGFNLEEGKTFPDNSVEYLESVNKSLSYSTLTKVSILAPMVKKTKKEIVEWGVKEDIDFSHLWSCYRGGEKMCGSCESCLRCQRALEEGGAGEWARKLF